MQALHALSPLVSPARRRQGESGKQGHHGQGHEEFHQREAAGVSLAGG